MTDSNPSSLESNESFMSLPYEENFYKVLKNLSYEYLDFLAENDSAFYQNLDLDKANQLIKPEKNLPLPQYLINYMEADINLVSKKEDSIVLKIGKEGLKILSHTFLKSTFTPLFANSASVRNHFSYSPQSLSAIENVGKSQILYNFVQENDSEIFLSLQLNDEQTKEFDQLILKKDNKFIYSTAIQDGQISISKLKNGNYNIELLGKNKSKRFDLSLCSDTL
jgi:hypothetical protein